MKRLPEYSRVDHATIDFEYYFMQTYWKTNMRHELLDKHEDNFIDIQDDGTSGKQRYELAGAMISWLDSGIPGLSSELYYDPSALNVDFMREVMRDIYTSLGHDQHYEMMWNRAM